MKRGKNKPRTKIVNERVSRARVPGRRVANFSRYCEHGVQANWAWRLKCDKCAEYKQKNPELRYNPKKRRMY